MADVHPEDDFIDPAEVEAMEEATADRFAAASARAGDHDDADHDDADHDDADPEGDAAVTGAGAPDDSAFAGAETVDDLLAGGEETEAVAAVTKERDDYLDALRRLQADFENFKKRSARQQTESFERAGEALVEKLLPVLDAIDLARQHGAGDAVDQIASALFEVLEREGLERIDEVGAPFDPNEHEAVSHQPAEEGDDGQVVAALMRTGYRWKGRLVRAAMVSVRG